MLKALIILLALILPLMPARALSQEKEAQAVSINEKVAKEAEYKLKANGAFIKAATQMVKESGDAEAASILKLAEVAAEEAKDHWSKGEYEFAIEDASESTRMATHAIVLSKNHQDSTLRDFVIKEELVLHSKHDIERKETMIRKGASEVEAFIKTAEKLATEDNWDPSAKAKIEQAKALLTISRTHIAKSDLDASLNEIKKAYKLITGTVKDMKRAKGEIITFPRPAVADEKEMLAYEIKKNDSYVFFATQIVNEGDRDGIKLINDAKALQGEAVRSIEAGERQKAIEKLKASTELYIRAIKNTGGQ